MMFSEAIKLKDGILYNMEYHQERVDRTMHNFHNGRIDLAFLRGSIPHDAQTGLFKCRVLYSDTIRKVEFIPYEFRTVDSIKAVTADDMDYSYKYADRSAINRLLEESGCDDIIIIKNGMVTDASSSNLVFESPEGLFTPKECLLRGTKRQQLLDIGTINERSIRAEDIKNYHTIHFINAMVDMEDEIKIGSSSCSFF